MTRFFCLSLCVTLSQSCVPHHLFDPTSAEDAPVGGGGSPLGDPDGAHHALGSHVDLVAQGFFLCTWLGTHATTMSQDVTDIRGERADFASGGVIFHRFVFE